jgi:translation initiation factor IF-3
LEKRILVNNQIRAEKVRVIDEEGKQLGIFSFQEALRMAKERNLDLIQVTEKVEPPVCKIGDLGKYLYWLKKKERKAKKISETKTIRLGFNISLHDLQTKANQAEKFLKAGNRVKIELILKGRQKGLSDFGKEKIEQFLQILSSQIPVKTEGELKKEPKGFTLIITKK